MIRGNGELPVCRGLGRYVSCQCEKCILEQALVGSKMIRVLYLDVILCVLLLKICIYRVSGK